MADVFCNCEQNCGENCGEKCEQNCGENCGEKCDLCGPDWTKLLCPFCPHISGNRE